MTVLAVVGAQYGSEGKGAIVAQLAPHFDVHVRTGAPNAGHTYYQEIGGELTKIVARSVPVGAINPEALLVLGPGAIIDPDLLWREVKELEAIGLEVRHRLYIDYRAVMLDHTLHHEGGVDGEAHRLIGSTGEGVGLARMAHMARTTVDGWAVEHAADWRSPLETSYEFQVVDTAALLDASLAGGAKILLEGTQGSGLSLTTGPWPFVTSNDTNSAQLLADAGLAPMWLSEVLLVARSYPIRVAGNSGPLFEETTFEEIGVAPEFTTVTKKKRRIGKWDDAQFARAVALNGPHPLVALTFADYIDPRVSGCSNEFHLTKGVLDFIHRIEAEHDVMVGYVGTGPSTVVKLEAARW